MSISNEITRLQNAKTAIATAITNKGVTVPTAAHLDNYATLIDDIPSGHGSRLYEHTYTSGAIDTIACFNATATVTLPGGIELSSGDILLLELCNPYYENAGRTDSRFIVGRTFDNYPSNNYPEVAMTSYGAYTAGTLKISFPSSGSSLSFVFTGSNMTSAYASASRLGIKSLTIWRP